MKQTYILVVDDDPSIRKFIKANLEARDYRVAQAGDGKEAIQIIEEELPDLILLDIMMPQMDGFQVCKVIREWSQIPIIMLSARDSEIDKIKCLDTGADDYLTKPFSLKELLSRINAVLRRSQITNAANAPLPRFVNGNLVVDYGRQVVTLEEKPVDLTGLEYKILVYLTLNAGRIITPNQLLEKIWGEEYAGDSRLLQVNICRLRRKLKDSIKNPRYIQTKPGIGYVAIPST
jgi:DNA-binding response OmpR family regulator